MYTENIIPLCYPGGNTLWQDAPQRLHILQLGVELYEELGGVGGAQGCGRFGLATQTVVGAVRQR